MPARMREQIPGSNHMNTAQWDGMKKTLHIDATQLQEAKSASGAKTDTDTVRVVGRLSLWTAAPRLAIVAKELGVADD